MSCCATMSAGPRRSTGRPAGRGRGGVRVYLKREDLNHTGAHKINNTLGQILLARRMGKQRIIAETGAGQHGVATATACALFGSSASSTWAPRTCGGRRSTSTACACSAPRCAPSIRHAHAEGRDERGMRDWVATSGHALYYRLGRRPGPVPALVRDLQAVIGARRASRSSNARAGCPLPSSPASAAAPTPWASSTRSSASRRRAGRRRGRGRGSRQRRHAASLSAAGPACCTVALSYLLQDEAGQVAPAHSISAGLDYPGVGPEHAHLKDAGPRTYVSVTDDEALACVPPLARLEGSYRRSRARTPSPTCSSTARAGGRPAPSSSASAGAATRTSPRSPRARRAESDMDMTPDRPAADPRAGAPPVLLPRRSRRRRHSRRRRSPNSSPPRQGRPFPAPLPAQQPRLPQLHLGAQRAIAGLWDELPAFTVSVEEHGSAGTVGASHAARAREPAIPVLQGRCPLHHAAAGLRGGVRGFLDVMNRGRVQDQNSDDDMVTLLWQQEFTHSSTATSMRWQRGCRSRSRRRAEADGRGADARAGGRKGAASGSAAAASAEQPASRRCGLINRDDFEETLYFLDQKELATLRQEVELELERDLKSRCAECALRPSRGRTPRDLARSRAHPAAAAAGLPGSGDLARPRASCSS
jgi:tryptophan synthase beta subunit